MVPAPPGSALRRRAWSRARQVCEILALAIAVHGGCRALLTCLLQNAPRVASLALGHVFSKLLRFRASNGLLSVLFGKRELYRLCGVEDGLRDPVLGRKVASLPDMSVSELLIVCDRESSLERWRSQYPLSQCTTLELWQWCLLDWQEDCPLLHHPVVWEHLRKLLGGTADVGEEFARVFSQLCIRCSSTEDRAPDQRELQYFSQGLDGCLWIQLCHQMLRAPLLSMSDVELRQINQHYGTLFPRTAPLELTTFVSWAKVIMARRVAVTLLRALQSAPMLERAWLAQKGEDVDITVQLWVVVTGTEVREEDAMLRVGVAPGERERSAKIEALWPAVELGAVEGAQDDSFGLPVGKYLDCYRTTNEAAPTFTVLPSESYSAVRATSRSLSAVSASQSLSNAIERPSMSW